MHPVLSVHKNQHTAHILNPTDLNWVLRRLGVNITAIMEQVNHEEGNNSCHESYKHSFNNFTPWPIYVPVGIFCCLSGISGTIRVGRGTGGGVKKKKAQIIFTGKKVIFYIKKKK